MPEDGFNLLFSGKIVIDGVIQTVTNYVLLSTAGIPEICAEVQQTFYFPKGQTITFNIEWGGINSIGVGELGYWFELWAQDYSQQQWIVAHTNNSESQNWFYLFQQTDPPTFDGVHWDFDIIGAQIVPDFNHDNVIDSSDITNATFHYWINDDANISDIASPDGSSEIPAQTGSSANYSSQTVCGRNDLQDFFPVWLNLNQLLNIYPPASGQTQYLLKQADGAVKIVYTSLSTNNAGDYLIVDGNTYGTGLSQPSYSATTVAVPATGLSLDAAFLNLIANDPSKGILLVEGTGATTAPLVVEIYNNGQLISSASMPLQLSTISHMYRWINLCNVAGGGTNDASNIGEPSNMSYEGLAIGDGGTASAEFLRVMYTYVDPADRLAVRNNLEEYCGQDTYAMVEILRKLETFSRQESN